MRTYRFTSPRGRRSCTQLFSLSDGDHDDDLRAKHFHLMEDGIAICIEDTPRVRTARRYR